MKKFLILLSTLLGAFFMFCFATNVYAAEDDLPEVTTTIEEVVEETTTTIEETEETGIDKIISDLVDIELSEEQVNAIADVIAAYTNEEVKNLSLVLYSALGIVGLVIAVLVIVCLVFAIKHSNHNENALEKQKALIGIVDEDIANGYENLVKKVTEENEAQTKLIKALFEAVTEQKVSKTKAKASEIDKVLGLVSTTKVE